MPLVYRQYENSNSSVLQNSLLRGEFLYRIKLYSVQQDFMNEQGAVLRLRVSLACVEAGAVVIDAYIQIDGKFAYLFVLCSSFLSPNIFSQAIKKKLPQASIEECCKNKAEIYLRSPDVHLVDKDDISSTSTKDILFESNKLLISLLIEYKAFMIETKKLSLLARCEHKRKHGLLSEAIEKNKYQNVDLKIDVVMFQKDSMILALPIYQVEKIDKDIFQKRYIKILSDYGGQKIFIDDVYLLKKIDLTKVEFLHKIETGIYEVEVQGNIEKLRLNFLVPSMQK